MQGAHCLSGRVTCVPSLKEHLFVSSIILIGRVLCKVTPAMPTWGLSPDVGVPHSAGVPYDPKGRRDAEQVPVSAYGGS